MLPILFFEVQNKTEKEQNKYSEEQKDVLNSMSDPAKDFAITANDKLSKAMRNPPEGFRDRSNEVEKRIKSLSEEGDIEKLIVEIDLFRTYLQDLSDKYGAYRTSILKDTMKEDPFVSMDPTIISKDKGNILDYISKSKKDYNAFKEMKTDIIKVLKSINDFDYSKAGVKKPDLTDVVTEFTDKIFDNKEDISASEKMLQNLLKESDSEAKSIEDLIENDEDDDDEIKEGITLYVDRPKVLSDAVKQLEGNLNDIDKNILNRYYDNKDETLSPYLNNGFITNYGTKKMTPSGLVLFCAMALNHVFPEREGKVDDDIDLRMESIDYKDDMSNAVIRYSIPEESKGADFDADNKRYGSDIDSQWLEARISPTVKMKDSMGRAELVIRTFDEDDPSKLVTNRGRRVPIVEFIKTLYGEEKNKNKDWRR